MVCTLAALMLVAALGLSFTAYYGVWQERLVLVDTVAAQDNALATYKQLLAQRDEQLDVHKELLRILRQESAAAAYDFSQVRAEVERAAQAIDDIKKLEEADKELLAKYSKVYFLNEHYTPERLAYVPSEYVFDNRTQRIQADVLPFLRDMFDAMRRAGLDPKVISAYRSFGYQEKLKYNHTVTYGTDVANRFVADQGYSEHQLGTTVDITSGATGADMLAFDTTPEYAWLRANAHKYGFVLSYPKGNAYYAFEPWHWRFVGVALATQLHREGKYFYDLPQREIDAYRLRLFER